MAASFGDQLKTIVFKGVEALGKGATALVDGAQQKLSEISMETRRREIESELAGRVQELYEQGVEFPEPLGALLNELSELKEKLSQCKPAPEAPAAGDEEPCEACCCETPEETPDSQPEESAPVEAAPEPEETAADE